MTLTNCEISENTAKLTGGGIFNGTDGATKLVNSHVFGNAASVDGGGIANGGDGRGTVEVNNGSTITGNTPNDCSGTDAC